MNGSMVACVSSLGDHVSCCWSVSRLAWRMFKVAKQTVMLLPVVGARDGLCVALLLFCCLKNCACHVSIHILHLFHDFRSRLEFLHCCSSSIQKLTVTTAACDKEKASLRNTELPRGFLTFL